MTYSFSKYVKYLAHGKSVYRLHSPFVFDFASRVLKDKRKFYAFDAIEQRRSQLLTRTDVISVTDLGAGTRKPMGDATSAGAITARAAIPPKFGRLLFRISENYKPERVLEMGSCTGIGTLYLGAGMGNGRLITLEGDPALSTIARESIARFPFNMPETELITGEFGETLPDALDRLERIDLAFIDGNHRKEPTIQYFEALIEKCHEHSILVFDDIHWSREMDEAWEAIKSHPRTRLTIDLYRMGLVFFRVENREVEHFMLYY